MKIVFKICFILILYQSDAYSMHKPELLHQTECSYFVPRSYLQCLPSDLLNQLLFFLETPGLTTDNREDAIREPSKAIREFLAVIREIAKNKKLEENLDSNRARIQWLVALAKANPNSFFLPNAISIASSLNTPGSSQVLKMDIKQMLESFKDATQEQKNKMVLDAIRVYPSSRIIIPMIEAGAQVNTIDKKSHYTLLRFAVEFGTPKLVRCLLERGAFVDIADKFNITPAMIATMKKNCKKKFNYLLQYEQFMNAADAFDCTALAYAARRGSLSKMKALIAKGASVLACNDNYNKNPIVQAVKSGSYKTLAYLLSIIVQKISFINIVNAIINLALQKAAKSGNEQMVNLLLYGPDESFTANRHIQPNPDYIIDYRNAISHAIESDHPQIAQQMITFNYDRCYKGMPTNLYARSFALALAAQKKIAKVKASKADQANQYQRIITMLLEENANPFLITHIPSACFIAADSGDKDLLHQFLNTKEEKDTKERVLLECIKNASYQGACSILDFGLEINGDINDNQDTCAHRVVLLPMPHCIPLLDLLVTHGADINKQNCKGDTPLHQLLKNITPPPCIAMTKALLQKGARTDLKNNKGNTPLLVATNNFKAGKEVIQTLVEAGSFVDEQNKKGDTPLICASRWEHCDAVEVLWSAHANPNIKNNSGCGALTKAARLGNKELLALLIKMGAHFDAFKDGMLREACKSGNSELVDCLVAYGADCNGQSSSYGNTPLHKAIEKNQAGIVEKLLKQTHQAIDSHKKNAHGITPLEYAAMHDDKESAQVLLKKIRS